MVIGKLVCAHHNAQVGEKSQIQNIIYPFGGGQVGLSPLRTFKALYGYGKAETLAYLKLQMPFLAECKMLSSENQRSTA
jgi:hypothetical protein